MTSRERVRRAIHFQQPDRIPHYLPDGLPNDLLWIAPWTVGKPQCLNDRQPWSNAGAVDRRIDVWGVVWERAAGRTNDMGQAKVYPIADIGRHQDYQLPELVQIRDYRHYKTAIAENNLQDNHRYALGVLPFSSLNEGIHNIIGLQNLFISYYEQPDALKGLISRFAEKQRQAIQMMAELGCDGVMAYDDWGLQDRLMISAPLIRAFFLEHYRASWSLAHQLGMEVWLHSCGHIIDILPDFIEAGLNVIQMDQQENMGLEKLGRLFGGRLGFWCPVDIQQKQLYGSEPAMQTYVRRMITSLGHHQGGLISMAYTTPEAIDLPPQGVAAMCRAFRKFERYC